MTEFKDLADVNQSFTSDVQLKAFAKANCIPLRAVLSKDQLPKLLRNGGYIVNMDDSYQDGSHWVAIYVRERDAVYFDSFGMPPPREILHALKPFDYTISRQIIQNYTGGFCGAYCIFFIWTLSRLPRISLSEALLRFQKLFSPDYTQNKRILLKYLGK